MAFGLPALEEIFSLLETIRHQIEVTGVLIFGMGFKEDMGYTFGRVIPRSEYAILKNLEEQGILSLKVSFPSSITESSIISKEKFYNFYNKVNDQIKKLRGQEKKDEGKIVIIIDDMKGIYRQDNPELCYTLGNNSKRKKLINYLFLKDRAFLSDIETSTNRVGRKELIMKEIREINDLFRKNLKVNEDLIYSIPTDGYCLNKDKFDIRMNS